MSHQPLKRIFLGAISALLLFSGIIIGCGMEPIVVYIERSSSPQTTPFENAASAATADVQSAPTQTVTSTPLASLTATLTQNTALTTNVGITPAAPTALPANFPTPLAVQIQVVEQLFENGRMFWLEPTKEVWILIVTEEGGGDWAVYQDTFQDGETESDPALTPPNDTLIQPVRGFGKLWREVPDLRETLGWAVTPEFGFLSNYEYQAGGTVNPSGDYVPGPGLHTLFSLYGERFQFRESDGTWALGGT